MNDWSTAVETGPGRIQVTVAKPDGSSQVVEIVMTPDEWDSVVSVIGDFESQTQRIRQTVLGLREHERFLVYRLYELVPSATAELPVDPVAARLDELARQRQGGIGRWVVTDQEKNVLD